MGTRSGTPRLAVTTSHGLVDAGLGAAGRPVVHEGVGILDCGSYVVVPRHGLERFVAPHRIDHRRNIEAILAADCDRVLALSSVGSLRRDWVVGTVVAPDDFYAPQVNPTRFDDERSHSVPGFDAVWRAEVVAGWRARSATPIVDRGVYAQTDGPRFETRAEIRALARFADLVGMTVAAECILAGETGIRHAAVCVVDNLANGLATDAFTIDVYRAGVAANRARLVADVEALLPTLAARSDSS
jgi:5'-methylthioadenosine phosphorylase